MTEVKKHYNPSTGMMEKCNAKSGNCPFGAHYTNEAEGQAYADEQNRLEANREKYVAEQPVEYEKHHQNMIANLNHDYDKNWEKTKYRDLDDFIKVEQENTKVYEEEIRNLQDGSSELRYISKDVGYPHPVEIRGDLSEKEIEDLLRKRESYAVGMLKGTLSKGIRTPSYMPFMVNGGMDKENLQKELDTDKKVIKYDNLRNMRSMLKDIEGFKKSTKLSDKNYTDTENGAMTINSLDYALNNMGYASSRLGDKEIDVNEGYENENYKVTFQKNGTMKINFKKKDIPEKLNEFRSEYLRESDGPLNQFKPEE